MRKFNLQNLMLATIMFVASLFVGCNTEDVDYDTPYVTLDKTTATVAATGGSEEFTVESNRPWKVEIGKDGAGADIDWVRVTPESGEGNGKITVTVLPVDGIEREATIKIVTATVWEAIRITQSGTVATNELINVTFGTKAVQTGTTWPSVADFDKLNDWGATGEGASTATFTGDCTIRSNSGSEGYPGASGSDNAYLGFDRSIQINNISVVGGGNQFNFTFGAAFFDGTADNNFKSEYIKVEASADGGSTWVPVTYTRADGTSDRWDYCTGSVVMAPGISKLSVRFKGALTAGQLRVDDVKIVALEADLTEPQVITGASSNVTSTSATLAGTFNFGTPASEVGFEYKKTADAAYQKVVGTGSVQFSANLSALTGNTEYTYRAYAIVNSVTSYGATATFTTIDPAAGTVLWKETLGNADASAKPPVGTYQGWATTGIGSATVTYSGVAETKVTIRAASTGVSSGYPSASGANYVYFGTGNPNSFIVSNISTGGAQNFKIGFGANKYVTQGPAEGNVVTAAELKVYYSTTGADNSYTEIPVTYSTVAGKWQYVTASFSLGAGAQTLWIKFTANVDSAISIDDMSLSTSDNVSVEPVPAVTTVAATSITNTGAVTGGSYTYSGTQTISSVGVAYKKSTDANYTEATATVGSTFSATLSGLTLGTTYSYHAFVKIGANTYEGDEMTFTTTGAAAKTTIAAIRTSAVDGAALPSGTLEGTVISDPAGKNTQGWQIVIVDGNTANCGITVGAKEQGATLAYVPGDKVSINLADGVYSFYSGATQIKVPQANITKLSSGATVSPVTILPSQILDYEAMLVSIATCQVVNADLAKKMNGNINMETQAGASFIMRTGTAATFKDDVVPQKSGTLTGIAGRFNTDAQIFPRTTTDLSAMTANRFGAAPEISFSAASFKATTATAGEALVGANIEIPYTVAQGTETYPNIVVTVSGAGIGTIPATINHSIATVTAGSGTLLIPVTGTPVAGEVTFSVAGITTAAITCSKTFATAGDGGSADFNTLTANVGYATATTTNGWSIVNAAILKGGAAESSPTFPFISTDDAVRAVCINGKTTAVGTITSPLLTGGCGSISFKYGHAFAEKNGISIKIEIKQNDAVVKTIDFTKPNADVAAKTAYDATIADINVTGSFVIVITNNSPSKDTGNKDRLSIWDLKWTGKQ